MTLETALQRIGAYTDQSIETPTGDDLDIKISLINRRLRTFSEAFEPKEFRVQSFGTTATTPLPVNFKKMASPVYINGVEYQEIDSSDRFEKTVSDEYFIILGNEVSGYNLVVPNGVASGASLVFDLHTFASSVATLTDTIPINTPDYIIQGTIADILEGRSDSRFTIAQGKADQILAQAIEKENTRKTGSAQNTVRKQWGTFVIGGW